MTHSNDIYEAIKKRPELYVREGLSVYYSLYLSLLSQLFYMEVKNINSKICSDHVLIISSLDWLSDEKGEFDTTPFHSLVTHQSLPDNSFRPEILFGAFDIDFYTLGVSGERGNQKLKEKLSQYIGKEKIVTGRGIIYSTY